MTKNSGHTGELAKPGPELRDLRLLFRSPHHASSHSLGKIPEFLLITLSGEFCLRAKGITSGTKGLLGVSFPGLKGKKGERLDGVGPES